MKKSIAGLTLFLFLLGVQALHAAPQRVAIKDGAKAAKEKAARAALKNIDLKNIGDPVAKQAIGEILNYLNLESKK